MPKRDYLFNQWPQKMIYSSPASVDLIPWNNSIELFHGIIYNFLPDPACLPLIRMDETLASSPRFAREARRATSRSGAFSGAKAMAK